MNVMQLNTDIYNSLGVLSNDESYLEKALATSTLITCVRCRQFPIFSSVEWLSD